MPRGVSPGMGMLYSGVLVKIAQLRSERTPEQMFVERNVTANNIASQEQPSDYSLRTLRNSNALQSRTRDSQSHSGAL